jgi:predicted dehydrogenase
VDRELSVTRIGVLGAGGVSSKLHLPVISKMADARVSWVCDKNKKRALELAGDYKIPSVFTGIEQCTDVDVVLVAVPVGYRQFVMQEIFKKGWHAFCEKPFAVKLDEHDSYLAQAEMNGRQVGVGLVKRYAATTVMARKLVASGILGPLLRIAANDGSRFKRTGQESGWFMEDPSIVGGGALMETGSHLIDQIFYITGARGFSVKDCSQRKYKGLDFATNARASISLPNQEDVECSANISWIEDLCNGIFLRFSNCVLKVGLSFEGPLEMMSADGQYLYSIDLEEGAATLAQGVFSEWRDFLHQCKTGKESEVSAGSTRDTTAFIETCYMTAKEM